MIECEATAVGGRRPPAHHAARRWQQVCLLLVLTLGLAACGQIPHTGQYRTGSASEFFPQEPFLSAARAAGRGGDAAELRRLLQKSGMDVNKLGAPARLPWTARKGVAISLLTWAVLSGNVEAAQVLLEAGADPDQVEHPTDVRALHLAALRVDDTLLKQLLARRADIGAVTNAPLFGRTALMWLLEPKIDEYTELPRSQLGLAGARRLERAEFLLRAGADVNQVLWRPPSLPPNDPQATRPIHTLANANQWGGVLWLLQHGVDPRSRNAGGRTIMCTIRFGKAVGRHYAANKTTPPPPPQRTQGLLDYEATLAWLFAHGVHPDELDLDKKVGDCHD